MIHAEISIYPVGTESTSISFYIAKAVSAIDCMKAVRCQVTPMGTVLEAASMNEIFEACDAMIETVHRLGVRRVETVLKIDSRKDKDQTIQDKMDSVSKHI